MSAIAVFRPEVGSKSLAAHAARSFTRVVESIAQRFQSSSPRVAAEAPSEHGRSVGSGLVQTEAVPLSAFGNTDQSSDTRHAERQTAESGQLAGASLSADIPAVEITRNAAPPKYSSPPVAVFALPHAVESATTLAADAGRIVRAPEARERLWKDCAVAAICSGIPGPASFRSTPQALGKPPSV